MHNRDDVCLFLSQGAFLQSTHSRSIYPGCCIPQLVEPSGPRPVTTLEARLGHITEHLLQLLGVAEHQRRKGSGTEEVNGFL